MHCIHKYCFFNRFVTLCDAFIYIYLVVYPSKSIYWLTYVQIKHLFTCLFIDSFIRLVFLAFLFVCLSIIGLGDYTTSLKRSSDEGLTLEESALKLLTVANLRYQLSW